MKLKQKETTELTDPNEVCIVKTTKLFRMNIPLPSKQKIGQHKCHIGGLNFLKKVFNMFGMESRCISYAAFLAAKLAINESTNIQYCTLEQNTKDKNIEDKLYKLMNQQIHYNDLKLDIATRARLVQMKNAFVVVFEKVQVTLEEKGYIRSANFDELLDMLENLKLTE
jgi:hypothetical protein